MIDTNVTMPRDAQVQILFRSEQTMLKTQAADIVVHGPNGQIVLIAEAKNRIGTSRIWAAETRRNMLSHGTIPNSPYLLFATPDRFYLWKDAGNMPEVVEPSYEIDANPFLQPYFEKAHPSPEEIGYYGFRLIVTAWINELINWGISPNVPEEQRKLLQDSGLGEALKNAKVAFEVPT